MPSTRTKTPPTMRCMDASSSCAGAMTRDRPRHFAITIITKGRRKKRCVSLDLGAPHDDGTGTAKEDDERSVKSPARTFEGQERCAFRSHRRSCHLRPVNGYGVRHPSGRGCGHSFSTIRLDVPDPCQVGSTSPPLLCPSCRPSWRSPLLAAPGLPRPSPATRAAWEARGLPAAGGPKGAGEKATAVA